MSETTEPMNRLRIRERRGDASPVQVPLSVIDDNPFRLREEYSEERIREMASSIRACGLMQVPVGRRTEEGRVQLAYGMTRLRAFRRLAEEDNEFVLMPVVIRELSDREMAVLTWEENEEREDCNAIEKARYMHRLKRQFGWTQARVAEYLGLARSTVANKLRLLRLPQRIQDNVIAGAVSERQAQAILSRSGDGARRVAALHEQARNGVSSDRLREQRNGEQEEEEGLEGCQCQRCGDHFTVDLLVPDEVWERIKPEGKARGGGLLCGACIMTSIEAQSDYDTWRLHAA